MKIEIATIQDVPEILELQYKAFRPFAESLNWPDALNLCFPMTENSSAPSVVALKTARFTSDA